MDDLLDSSSSLEDIMKTRDETTELLGEFGFNVKMWYSNEPSVGQTKQDIKTLGMQWNSVDDKTVNQKKLTF